MGFENLANTSPLRTTIIHGGGTSPDISHHAPHPCPLPNPMQTKKDSTGWGEGEGVAPCRNFKTTVSVSLETVEAREDFLTTDGHGLTRMRTGFSLIRVHPCSSVVGSYWLRLC